MRSLIVDDMVREVAKAMGEVYAVATGQDAGALADQAEARLIDNLREQGLRVGAAASLFRMAIAVGSGAVVRVIDNALSAGEETVRNNGPDPVTLSKDPAVVAGGGFQLALNGTQEVTLEVGEALYAICAATKTASLEVI